MIYELTTHYDSRKSFYGKAKVEEQGHIIILWSYETQVLKYDEEQGFLKIFGIYSNTTLRHIKEFLKQQFNKDFSISEIKFIISENGLYI